MKTSKNIFSYIRVFAVALSAVLLTSCLKDLSNDQPISTSALNVVNASPGPLTINFFLDNSLVNGPALGYGQESSYILAKSGNRKFDAAQGGSFNSLLADTVSLENDKYYSLFVTGENTALSTLLTQDDLSLPASGKARLRFINLSPDGGTFSLAIQNGQVLFTGQAYKTASAFSSIDPGAYMFQLRGSDGVVEHEASLDVVAGKIYTIWAGGLKDGIDELDLRLLVRANN
ncbi:MAG: DUF4397 domain-containing protein [Daejeonella sp.]|uniref:DUF4397 domain-containing protein n=1 Tax=Daejeonella sp. JGW-45 TaxID=3034148 RepID=UPI0023ECB1B7|nr:DUF4397 domain-containing protein [Daejeonella sp. JGW-45]